MSENNERAGEPGAADKAAREYAEVERQSRGPEVVTGHIAEAFNVQVEALRNEATSWREAAEKTKAELAAAQQRLGELEATAAAAKRSLAEAQVRESLSLPGVTPLQLRGVLAEVGADIYDDEKRPEAIARAQELLRKELGASATPLSERVKITSTRPGLVRM